ncbi:holo-[acyl-carrier-protein] synthase [Brevibacillus reuszeri]|uniref:holo-ACP synthase n=1 Tax=Brevibacillus reuszeri TaxID=54915 RepID=UPI001B1668ED|nr:holo-ACP synthase [Brevibacillus reuszeri]GIO09337.1 holo-[acyl-carrier-protein] synthase [Brevibacillus reuszeri]
MIVGIGVDIVEIERISKLVKRQKNAISRFLTIEEQQLLQGKPEARQAEFIAGRFAAKEAGSKALGTGIGGTISFLDMEVLPTERGKPEMKIKEEVYERLGLDPSNVRVHLSISHSIAYAIAQVVVEQV